VFDTEWPTQCPLEGYQFRVLYHNSKLFIFVECWPICWSRIDCLFLFCLQFKYHLISRE
jgi:hypothetical protein